MKDMSVPEAYAAIVDDCISQIASFEEGTKQRQSDSLHKMRVGIRRLRTARTIFKGTLKKEDDKFVKDLRWLQLELGRARDWDVFIGKTVIPVRDAIYDRTETNDISKLILACQRERDVAYAAVKTALESRRYKSFIDRIKANHPAKKDFNNFWRAGQASDLADTTIRKRTKKIKKLGKDTGNIKMAELHELRKQCKKLRYGVEFFAKLYPKKQARAYREILNEVQDTIGSITDAKAGETMLKNLRTKKKRDKAALNRARAVAYGWMFGVSFNQHALLKQTWSTFLDLIDDKPLWKAK